jgi:hypothetical protein
LICGINKDKLEFFAIGDTGGDILDVRSFDNRILGVEFNIASAFSYVRPTSVQLRVAGECSISIGLDHFRISDSMAKLASRKGLDFVINVGGKYTIYRKN